MTSSFLGSRTALPQAARPARSSCSRMVVRAAADSPVWLPGTDKPKQLEGLVGNFGFDPLQLGTDKERLEWCAGLSYRHRDAKRMETSPAVDASQLRCIRPFLSLSHSMQPAGTDQRCVCNRSQRIGQGAKLD